MTIIHVINPCVNGVRSISEREKSPSSGQPDMREKHYGPPDSLGFVIPGTI